MEGSTSVTVAPLFNRVNYRPRSGETVNRLLKKLLEGGGVGDGSELTSGDLAIAGPPERELGWHRQGVSHSDGPA
jgi:hypothetical protein